MELRLNVHQGECLSPFIEQMILDSPPLSAEAERRLLYTMPRDFAEQQIVLHCLGYAAKIARSQNIPGMTLEDIFQCIVLVMVKSIKKFDIEKCDPEMSFTGYVRTAIDRHLMLLSDPAWGSNDAKMNLLTSTLSAYSTGDEGDVEDALAKRIQEGKEIACLEREEYIGENPLGLENLIYELRLYKENIGYATTHQRQRFEEYLDNFIRFAKGESLTKIAAEKGYPDQSSVRYTVNVVRSTIIKMLLGKRCPVEWKWILDKSTTLHAVAKIGLQGRDLSVAYARVAKERDDKKQASFRHTAIARYFDTDRNRYVAFFTDRMLAQAQNNREYQQSVAMMNYDKFLGNVYQRKYKLHNTYRPDRGGTHSAEGYIALSMIEQQHRARERIVPRRELTGDFHLVCNI